MALLLILALGCLWPPPAWGQPEVGSATDADPSGAKLFALHCAGCHVHGGNIIRRGKTLKLAALERNGITGPEMIARIAAEGIGQMGGYAAALGSGGPEMVGDWVWQQAQNAWIQG
ncbi:MAG: cytochrome C [Cyanobacteriota bacterium]|nr:cytochrome C [Cyanobacteriota bacterium]